MKALAFAAWLIGAPGAAHAMPDVEIRFCPGTQVRTYPLDDHGRQRSLLLHAFTIINRGPENLQIERIDLLLLDKGRVVDTRVLDGPQIERWAGNGPPVQNAMAGAPFLFCGDSLVPANVSLAGPDLAPGQGLIVANQIFAFDQAREALRVDVHGRSTGSDISVSVAIPIRSDFAQTRYALPLNGEWYVEWGASLHSGHRTLPFQEFAFDFVKPGPEGARHRGDGSRFDDYFAYGAPVMAAANGRVVRAVDGRPEAAQALRRNGESPEEYAIRHAADQTRLVASARDGMAGNYVVIDHGGREFSFYAHLQPGSIGVSVGDQVTAGDLLGRLGSSGQSTEPHLHFHVCDSEDLVVCAGIPVKFDNVHIRGDDVGRAIQSGDFVATQ